ncbi:hypothetical protein MTR67_002413, partial [Solanum verrucosum]
RTTNDHPRVNRPSDRPALLFEVSVILTNLKCNVVNAKIWTHNVQAAAIMQVTGKETVDKDYFVVTIWCKDRPKLLFDTICTLNDMQYVVFHENVDAEGPVAHQVQQFSIHFEITFMVYFS